VWRACVGSPGVGQQFVHESWQLCGEPSPGSWSLFASWRVVVAPAPAFARLGQRIWDAHFFSSRENYKGLEAQICPDLGICGREMLNLLLDQDGDAHSDLCNPSRPSRWKARLLWEVGATRQCREAYRNMWPIYSVSKRSLAFYDTFPQRIVCAPSRSWQSFGRAWFGSPFTRLNARYPFD
jgi:hypothetical protein